MVKIRDASTPTEANQKIGGVPTLYYFDFESKGRGEALRLFFEDAGIAYNDVRVSFSEAAQFQEDKLKGQGWNPTLSFPIVELNGEHLTQSYAILRYLSRKLDGVYDGKTHEEQYFVDVISDIVSDFRTLFVNALFSAKKDTEFPAHVQNDIPRYVGALEKHLARRETGPFVLGESISYADLLVFQIVHDEGFDCIKDAPTLKRLVNAVQARPNVANYFKSNRYHG